MMDGYDFWNPDEQNDPKRPSWLFWVGCFLAGVAFDSVWRLI